MLDVLSIVCLAIVSAICWLGLFAKIFKDNWLQFCGLLGMAMWSTARAWQFVDYATSTPQQAAMHVALACLLLGTAQKVWQHRPSQGEKGDPPTPLPPEHLQHVAGGTKSP